MLRLVVRRTTAREITCMYSRTFCSSLNLYNEKKRYKQTKKILESNVKNGGKTMPLKSNKAQQMPVNDVEDSQKLSPEIQNLLEKVNSMTSEELELQKFLDGDKPFMSVQANEFIIRKNIIRDLPDSIDLLKPEEGVNYLTKDLEGINRIYESLNKLDADENLHNKYYERYGLPVNDVNNELTQAVNGIKEKFRLLRREESLALPLYPEQFRLDPNLFNMPYNVPGFDVSISGLPLLWSNNKDHKIDKSRVLPPELVKDFRMYETSVPIHKRDLDFESDKDIYKRENAHSVTVHPDVDTQAIVDTIKFHEMALEVPDLDKYNLFPARTSKHISLMTNVIFLLKRKLAKDVEREYEGILMAPNFVLKKNQFQLYEKKQIMITHLWNQSGATELNLPIQFQELSVLPLGVYNIKTRKERAYLRMHLYKIFRVNLEDQIDILIRIKYKTEEEKNMYLRCISQKIYDTIDNDIIDSIINACAVQRKADAYIFQPFKDFPFKRIVWGSKRWRAFNNRKWPKLPVIQAKVSDLNTAVESSRI